MQPLRAGDRAGKQPKAVRMTLDKVLARIDADLDDSLARLFALLRIPSVSTDPGYASAVSNAADWCVAALGEIGFEASVRATAGHPMVVAHQKAEGGPHVLFYGHYDVQPVDPLELWESDPFEPQVMARPDGSKIIVGRGSADDKGQLMTFLEACRAWRAEAGSLPVGVSVLLEGEEESGSPSLAPFLEDHRDELAADLALVCDTNMWDRATPGIVVMLRGLVGEEVTLTCADKDLHSGLFGGAAHNPLHILASILAGLHDEDGRVTLPGFYDGVEEIPAEVRTMWQALGFDEVAFLAGIGLRHSSGESGRSALEKIWTRPTAEVNGIHGGYTGEGIKTVIPSQAHAKVSFRLVGKQDPQAVRRAFRTYVESRVPDDCTVAFNGHGGSPGVQLPYDSPALTGARAALEAEWGRPPALIGMGGSIPIVGEFKRRLGMDSLMVGFGLEDDRIHSPNEKYELTSFHKGIRSWARILAALADGRT
jgi:acetylornithine deacetylase/succinyl-diaminopimelate desuccinylase-like protein